MTKEPIAYNGVELSRTFRVEKLKYLVVGTGRCGTVYLAKLLSSLGIPCTHEGIFRHDGLEKARERLSGTDIEVSEISKLASVTDEKSGVAWFLPGSDFIQAESSYMAAPFLNDSCLDNVAIIHVIRHPMKVINSFVAGLGYFADWCLSTEHYAEYHKFIYTHVPAVLRGSGPLARAALYWAEWNLMIERLAANKKYFLYRIERPESHLLRWLGFPPTTPHYKNTKSNTKVGLVNVYTKFSQIVDNNARRALQLAYEHFYSAKIL